MTPSIPNTLLLVEDEPDAGMLLRDYLRRQGYTVRWYTSGDACARELPALEVDLAILDVMVPGLDGYQLLEALRHTPHLKGLPVIMLTARDRESDVVEGLTQGADAYIRKPAGLALVAAHVQRLLNRISRPTDGPAPERHYGPLRLQPEFQQAYLAEQSLQRTPTEYQVLELMLADPDKAYSRAKLLSLLDPGAQKGLNERTVDAHMKNLRSKLGPLSGMIYTVRGVGYGVDPTAYAEA